MNRRSFLYQGTGMMAAIPAVSALMGTAFAQSSSSACSDWIDAPGFGGKLKVKPLWLPDQPANSKASCKLFQIEEGVVIPRHLHPEGEFTFVIEGSFTVEDETPVTYQAGDSIYMPPGSIHNANVSHGVRILSFTPTPVLYRF